MEAIWQSIVGYLAEHLPLLLKATITLALGLLIARFASRALERLLARRAGKSQALLGRRVAFYIIAGISLVSALGEFGIDMSVLLGAAGLLTVAVGFASQTSASNLISGLFLLAERPFAVDDTIRVGATTGRVAAIDMLSVKLQTPDNLYVRIPNETLLKSEITNLTHYPIRRLDILVGVAYDTDLTRAFEVLLSVAEGHPQCLDEPRPMVWFMDFADSAMQLRLSAWIATEAYWDVAGAVRADIKAALDAAGITIPFPQRTLHLATAEAPLTIAHARPAPGAEAARTGTG